MSFNDNDNENIDQQDLNSEGGDAETKDQSDDSLSGGLNFNGEGNGEAPFVDTVEEKKPRVSTTTMLMVGLSALGGLGVWLMVHRISAANAAPVNVESAQAKQTINNFLGNGSASIRSMEQMLRNTQKVVEQFLNYPSMTQVPLSDLRTNPFRLKVAKTGGEDPNSVAERRKREEERVAALKAVQSLQLQSVMYSDARKACMINNVMYREGQQVDNFTVDKINATSVVVRAGLYRFELKMQR